MDKKSVAQGNASAQYNLGLAYQQGIGVRQSDEAAMALFRLAAEQGHPMAAHNLGGFYYEGRGVARDLEEAARWVRLAADRGDPEAQYRLAVMYGNGEGLAKDVLLAVKWLRAAASQGHAAASHYISHLDAELQKGRSADQQRESGLRRAEGSEESGAGAAGVRQGDGRVRCNGCGFYSADATCPICGHVIG
ncbi:MAG: sel1 repeat family protein [Deltaproteobacteria bacterium]|nr:sel1 repeat family protein [Deltaproteobacteria bacterium]